MNGQEVRDPAFEPKVLGSMPGLPGGPIFRTQI